ncbi:MAG: hypothetical protein ACK5ME_08830 [Parahaliea sp.]
MRFEGPVVRQMQHLFATGPAFRNSAMPEMFESLLYAARRELFISTPYYVSNTSLQAALCAAANRGC